MPRKKRKPASSSPPKRSPPEPSGSRERGSVGTEASAPARERRTPFEAFRENAEALVVAILLAVIIRHFSVEAFEIPTGSMAPTLYGMHVWSTCPNCSTEYNIGLSPNSTTGKIQEPFRRAFVLDHECETCGTSRHFRAAGGGTLRPGEPAQCQGCGARVVGERGEYRNAEYIAWSARCPTCHHRYVTLVERGDVCGGNKILVNKASYVIGSPRRWDVIVFEFDQWKNYIKRLVGLPGETIHIYDGDVYCNGSILRKTDHPFVQEEMWQLISDSDVRERGLNTQVAWSELFATGTGAWSHQRDRIRWSLNATEAREPAVLAYQRPFDNFISYNIRRVNWGSVQDLRHEPGGGFPRTFAYQVGDRKVSFRVTPIGDSGWIGAEIRDADFTFRLEIPVGEASSERPARIVRVTYPEEEAPAGPGKPASSAEAGEATDEASETTAAVALEPGVTVEVEFENVDDRVAARIDGEAVLSLDFVSCPDIRQPPAVPPGARGSHAHHLWLLGAGTRANFEAIRVYRDSYYLNRGGPGGQSSLPWGGEGITLGEGEYLPLGDNSSSSSDGRVWGFVPAKNLMGKALLVFWPALPLNFQCKFIR